MNKILCLSKQTHSNYSNIHTEKTTSRKKIILPQKGDKVLVVLKSHLDGILSGRKTLECRSKPLRNLKKGDPMFFQEKNKKGTIRGYGIFRGLVEFKSESHFKKLVGDHGVKCTLKDSRFKFGWRFSSPHEYEETIIVDSRGQQRKTIQSVYDK